MAGEVTFNNWVSYETWHGAVNGASVYNTLITETIKQMDLDRENDLPMYMDYMWFIDTTLLNPDQQFSVKFAPNELDQVEENAQYVNLPQGIWSKKWLEIKNFKWKVWISDEYKEWINKSWSIQWAPDDIQAAFFDQAENTMDLVQAARDTAVFEMVKLWTNGFDSITASYGPWSGTPKWLTLFNASHTWGAAPTMKTTGTFSNLQTWALSATTLQEAIDKLKWARLENGRRIKQPSASNMPYILFTSTVNAVDARKILNTQGEDAGEFNGSTSNTNAMALNQFSFYGNKVAIMELDRLWDYDKDWNQVWTDDYWFVSNPVAAKKHKTFRYFELTPITVKNWQDDETDQYFTWVKYRFGVDHYYGEYGLVGSKWES